MNMWVKLLVGPRNLQIQTNKKLERVGATLAVSVGSVSRRFHGMVAAEGQAPTPTSERSAKCFINDIMHVRLSLVCWFVNSGQYLLSKMHKFDTQNKTEL